MTPMPLAIATIEAPRIDEGLREQGVEPLVVEWAPPARGEGFAAGRGSS